MTENEKTFCSPGEHNWFESIIKFVNLEKFAILVRCNRCPSCFVKEALD